MGHDGVVSSKIDAEPLGDAMNILLVEDDPAQASFLEMVFNSSGHDTTLVTDGECAIRFLKTREVDFVVLDWCLTGVSGFDVLRWIRSNLGVETTVVFLTARTLEVDVVAALDAGADEYIGKPCRQGELAARLKALLRLHDRGRKDVKLAQVGPYVLDATMRTILLRGQSIELTEKEFALAACLFENCGKVVSRELLGALVWGRALDGMSRSLDTHIYRIRQKLALRPENGVRLSAVYMHGYRLDEVDVIAMPGDSPRMEQGSLRCA